MIKLRKCDSSLEMSPFSASSIAPREEGKMMLEGHSPSHFQIISGFLCAADWNLMTRRAGLWSPLLDFRLGGWLLGHFSSCFVYRGSLVSLGFGPLVNHWGVGFGPWWTEKISLYRCECGLLLICLIASKIVVYIFWSLMFFCIPNSNKEIKRLNWTHCFYFIYLLLDHPCITHHQFLLRHHSDSLLLPSLRQFFSRYGRLSQTGL